MTKSDGRKQRNSQPTNSGAAAVTARQREVGGSLATAHRWRQLGGSSAAAAAVAAAQKRTSAAAWRRGGEAVAAARQRHSAT